MGRPSVARDFNPWVRGKETAMTEDHAPGLERAFAAPAEQCCVPRIEGEVPAFLRGTYYLNGPARFERGEAATGHWLDGDGMVCALRFGAERGPLHRPLRARHAARRGGGRGPAALPLVRHGFSGRPAGARRRPGIAAQRQHLSLARVAAGLRRAGAPLGAGPGDAGDPRRVQLRRRGESGEPVRGPSEDRSGDRGAVQLRDQLRLRPAEPQPLPLRRRRGASSTAAACRSGSPLRSTTSASPAGM